jgi:hypothetical protein
MSIKAMMNVWQHSNQRGSALVVMLALADMANDDFECYPGKAKLSVKCRLTVRNLTTILGQLEAAGELMIIRRRVGTLNQSNIYKLTLGVVTPESLGVVTPRSSGSDSGVTRGSDSQITRVVTLESPDPLFKQDSETSEKPGPNLIIEALKKRGELPQ